MYQIDRSKRPNPITVNPITDPAANATLSPLLRPFDAAFAVRQFAIVAVLIPMKPAKPEKKPPVKKANGVKKLRYFK